MSQRRTVNQELRDLWHTTVGQRAAARLLHPRAKVTDAMLLVAEAEEQMKREYPALARKLGL